MTTLEIVLSLVLWVLYGVVAVHRSKNTTSYIQDPAFVWICYLLVAPVVFFVKALYGAFKEYK